MEALYIFILSITSIIVLFIITKLIGFRQISELSFFDYVVGITIGSIAAQLATDIDDNWWHDIMAMIIYGLFGVLLPKLSQKNLKARAFIAGKPIILISNGRIIKSNLKKAKIELDDLISCARGNGYFNLKDIDNAIMETSGKISFQPIASKRQLTPEDFNFYPEAQGLYVNLIMDGVVIEDNLKTAGISKTQLFQMLKDKGEPNTGAIILAFIDKRNEIFIFK